MIHLWDEISQNLLSSKHDPFEKKNGEMGLLSSTESGDKSSSPSPSSCNKPGSRRNTKTKERRRKKKNSPGNRYDDGEEGIRGAIKHVLKLGDDLSAKKKKKTNKLEDLSVTELFQQMECHKQHLKYLQENDMCTPEDKTEVMGMVKDIYKVITIQSYYF